MQLSEKTSGKRRDGKERCEMALKIEKEFFGVVMSPRREDVYDNGGGVLYPRVVELHHAGKKTECCWPPLTTTPSRNPR